MIYLIISIILFAYISAKYDYIKILYHDPITRIDHIKRWLFRALFGITLSLTHYNDLYVPIWFSILLIIAFTFSISFRLFLNYFRNIKFNYISNSNIYDSIFLKISKSKGGYFIYIFELVIIIIGFYIKHKLTIN